MLRVRIALPICLAAFQISEKQTLNPLYDARVCAGFTGHVVLPFEPVTMTFQEVQYFVDTPPVIMYSHTLHIVSRNFVGQALIIHYTNRK